MRIQKPVLLIAFLCSVGLASAAVQAASGDRYWVAQAGLMNLGVNNADSAYAVGTYFGYGITNRLSVETELNSSVSGGEYRTASGKGHYELWTLGVYGAYRHPLSRFTYLKAKGGYLYEDVVNHRPNGLEKASSDSGVAGGLGVGYMMRRGVTLEFEASQLDSSVSYLSIGAHAAF